MPRPHAAQYQILGPVAVHSGGTPTALGGPKQRLVLALLLVQPDRVVNAEQLIDGVWEEEPPAGAQHTLQGYVSELRKALPDPLTFESGGYRLRVSPTQIDGPRFEALVDAGRHAVERSPAAAAESFREALALWRAEAFADLRYAEALQTEIRRLDELRTTAIQDRLDADLALGRHLDLVDELEGLSRAHPFREPFWAQLMLALYRSGRRPEALRAYERARQVLAEELAIPPGAELQELRRRISAADPSLDLSIGTRRQPRGASRSGTVQGFELRSEIGRGSLGVVYRAYQPSVGREVAVKIIAARVANAPEFVRRFDDVARRIGRLEHPNIVTLHDFWRDPQGGYLAEPLYRQGNLEDSLEHGAWALAPAVRAIDQIGGALAHAHRLGVIHGDLDGREILLGADGDVLVSDFALKTLLPADNGSSAGSAPSDAATDPGVGTDVRAFALIVHRLLTAMPVARGIEAGLLAKLRPDVPAEVDGLLRAAEAGRYGASPTSMAELVRDLGRAFGRDGSAIDAVAHERPAQMRNPYKGLRAFDEEDATDYFGREGVVARALDVLRDRRLVAVVGSSGSGKSSLVRAGIVPALRRAAIPGSDEWLVATLVPGRYPFQELELALRSVAVTDVLEFREDLELDDRALARAVRRVLPESSTLLLIVDQLEEIFSAADLVETSRFLANLSAAACDLDAPVRIIVTARADYFDRLLDMSDFGTVVREGLVVLSAPTAEELTMAIDRPAQRAGLSLEPGLDARIVADVAGRPGALPLMQHVLSELFHRRRGGLLTLDGYEAAGGVLGALGNRAEQVYADLSENVRAATRPIFMRLVSIDENGVITRRRMALSELAAIDLDPWLVDQVMEQFGAHRLLSFDRDPVNRGPTVEVAHEALFSGWSRLAAWVDERREDLRLHRRLSAALHEWQEADSATGFYLSGGRLDQLGAWVRETDLRLTKEERDFVDDSQARRGAELAAGRRRRRVVAQGLIGASALGLVLVGLAWGQWQRAVAEERTGRVRELIAHSDAAVGIDPELRILLAVEATTLADESGSVLLDTAVSTLHSAVLANRQVFSLPAPGEAAWSPDGAQLLTGGEADDTGDDGDAEGVSVWDVASRSRVARLDAPTGAATYDVAWSPDGRYLATTYEGGAPGAIWDAETFEPVAQLDGHTTLQYGPAFSPDGSRVAVLNGDLTASVWDVANGLETRLTFKPLPDGDPGLPEFSPDGTALAVPVVDQVKLFDPATGELRETLGPLAPNDPLRDLAYSPDGTRLATLSFTGAITVLDVATGMQEVAMRGLREREIAWSPRGDRIAAAGERGVVTVWDAASGEVVDRFAGHGSSISGLTFSPDGRWLTSSDLNDWTRVWDVDDPGTELAAFSTRAGVDAAAWTADGLSVVASGHDGMVTLWSSGGGASQLELDGQQTIGPMRPVVSPDGRYIAVTGPGYTTTIVEPLGLRELRRLEPGGHPGSFSTTGRYLAVGNLGAARVYEVESWALVGEFVDPQAYFFFEARFLPGDRWVLLTDDTGPPRLWDPFTDRSVVVDFEGAALAVAVARDGSRIAAANYSTGAVRVWDTSGFLSGTDQQPRFMRDLRLPPRTQALAFGPDPETLLAGGFDERITLWDLRSGQPGVTITHGSVVGSIDVSADGQTMLVAGDPTRTYTLSTEQLVDIALARVSRRLTDQECERFLGETCDHAGSSRWP
jgi:WD40 repeat protein/DNA-binding SARP family transcriptional activator